MSLSYQRNVPGQLQQLDFPNIGPEFGIFPRYARPALMGHDFIHFVIPDSMKKIASKYTVVVTPLDTTDYVPGKAHVRSFSKLLPSVKLPDAVFDPARAKIGLLPDSENMPSFEAKLIRGGTYIIPDVSGRNGRFNMNVLGLDWAIN